MSNITQAVMDDIFSNMSDERIKAITLTAASNTIGAGWLALMCARLFGGKKDVTIGKDVVSLSLFLGEFYLLGVKEATK